MTEEEKKQAESEELNRLIGKGLTFTVERTLHIRQKGMFSFLRRRIKKIQYERLTIYEPTLSTLDRIAAEQIEIELDEKKLWEPAWQNEVHNLKRKHVMRLAKIIALAVLGEDYYIIEQHGKNIIYKADDEKLSELTQLIAHGVKPSKLVQLAGMVNTVSNMGDFMNSIRLMSGNRTTMPILVEQED